MTQKSSLENQFDATDLSLIKLIFGKSNIPDKGFTIFFISDKRFTMIAFGI